MEIESTISSDYGQRRVLKWDLERICRTYLNSIENIKCFNILKIQYY